jgi:hypothetical protein
MKARRWFFCLVAASGLVACTTLTEELPHQPDPGGPVSGHPPIVVIPVPIPSPQEPVPPAGGTPTPPQAPPPAPPPPSAQSCSLPPGNGSGNDCPRESPSFLPQVEGALDQLVKEEPNVFDLNQTQGCGNCYKVDNVQRYITRMPQLMEQRGLCSMYDGEELAVKNSNSFNDQYDILTAQMFIRRDQGSYRSTCYPAWF